MKEGASFGDRMAGVVLDDIGEALAPGLEQRKGVGKRLRAPKINSERESLARGQGKEKGQGSHNRVVSVSRLVASEKLEACMGAWDWVQRGDKDLVFGLRIRNNLRGRATERVTLARVNSKKKSFSVFARNQSSKETTEII